MIWPRSGACGWNCQGRGHGRRAGAFAAGGAALPERGDEAITARDQGGDVGVLEAIPNLGLPQRIKTLDEILQAVLGGRGEDRRDVQLQTQPHDLAQGVGITARPQETQIVVELGEGGPAVPPPMRGQGFQHARGRA